MIDATGPVHRPARSPLLGDRAGFPRYSGHTLSALPGKRVGSPPPTEDLPCWPGKGSWGQPHSGRTKDGGRHVTLQKDPLIAIGDIQGNSARGQWELSSAPHITPVWYKGQQHLHNDRGPRAAPQ